MPEGMGEKLKHRDAGTGAYAAPARRGWTRRMGRRVVRPGRGARRRDAGGGGAGGDEGVVAGTRTRPSLGPDCIAGRFNVTGGH